MARVLGEGHVPPVWAPDLGAGHGQPLFEFAPPLVYAAALPFYVAGLGIARALQLGLAVLHILGAVAVYRLGRRLSDARFAAVGGAAAWLFAPYLSLDLFVRGAFAEAAALAMAPAALLGLLRAMDEPTASRIAAAGVAIALIPLAHNAAALLLLPAFSLIALAIAATAERRVAAFASGGAALVLALALSAYFWLPALVEKEFAHVERLRQGSLRWSEHAVAPAQLLWSPWGHGYSGPETADGMSFALGAVHLLLGVAGTVAAARSSDRRRRALALSFAVTATAGAWLSTTWAAPVWSRVETLQYLAYPWRALLLPGLFLPLLAVFAFERARKPGTWALAGLLVAVNLPHTMPKGFLALNDKDYQPAAIARQGLATTLREEYEPRWVTERPPFSRHRLVGPDGPLDVTRASRRASREELVVRVSAATRAEWATFYYPGWTLTIDGVRAPIVPVPVRGTIGFALPPGEHRLVLELLPTRVRKAGMVATLLAAFVVAAVGVVALASRSRAGAGSPYMA